jgi:GTP-binding protein Era
LGALLEEIDKHIPIAAPVYDADDLTDRSVRFLASELIREQVFLLTEQEVPYGVAVEIEVFDESAEITHIQALVHVERTSQRGILIGKGGSMVKAIGTAARKEIETMLDSRVRLEVLIRVEPNWSERLAALRRFGYGQR